jgi:hypothetical protein
MQGDCCRSWTFMLAGCLTTGVVGCGSSGPAVEAPAPVVVRAASPEAPAPVLQRPERKNVGPATKPALVPTPAPAAGLAKQDRFAFPGDKGGRLAAELLGPSEEAFAVRLAGRLPRRGLLALERPELPLQAFTGQVPRSQAAVPARPARPRALPEELPLTEARADGRLPQRVALSTTGLVRLPAPDATQPPPLPILGRAQPDRGPLGDPTGPASLEAALAAAMPVRAAPAPFDRPGIPDPFENRQAVRLAAAPPEEAAPPQLLPPKPPLTLPEKGR